MSDAALDGSQWADLKKMHDYPCAEVHFTMRLSNLARATGIATCGPPRNTQTIALLQS